MNQIFVIGPTFVNDVIYLSDRLSDSQLNNGRFSNVFSGGCYSIAYTLAKLNTQVNFVTRLSYDDFGTTFLSNLERMNVLVYSRDISITTPKRLTIIDKRNEYIIDDFSLEMHPALDDSVPSFFIGSSDYGLINLINDEMTEFIITHFKTLRWVSYEYIPADELLNRVDGIVLPVKIADSFINNQRYEDIARNLFEKGVNWFTVIDGGKTAWYYNRNGESGIIKPDYESVNNFYVGADEMFVADLLSLLSKKADVKTAVSLALDFSAHKLDYIDTIIK